MLTSKITSPEIQQRRPSVIANLKNQSIEKKELKNGFAFKVVGTDEMVVLGDLYKDIEDQKAIANFQTTFPLVKTQTGMQIPQAKIDRLYKED